MFRVWPFKLSQTYHKPATEDKSGASSRCNAFYATKVNNLTYAFFICLVVSLILFTNKGPAKSTPTCVCERWCIVDPSCGLDGEL